MKESRAPVAVSSSLRALTGHSDRRRRWATTIDHIFTNRLARDAINLRISVSSRLRRGVPAATSIR